MIEAEEEAVEDLVAGEEASGDGKCTTLLVPSAVEIVKFHSCQRMTDRYTVVTVLKKGEMKMEIPGNQEDEASAGQILKKDDLIHRIAVTAEVHAGQTMDN